MAVVRVQHPLDHRPRHLRKPRHEVNVLEIESRYAVVGIGNNAGAQRKLAHCKALRCNPLGVVHKARADFGLGVGMQLQPHTRSICRTLARVIVGRGADAAKAEYHVRQRQCTLQRRGDQWRIVTEILRPCQFQPTCRQGLDQLRHVLVLTLARQNFVADDDCPELHCASFYIAA